MIGDLDLLQRKEFYIKYCGKEWAVPELTNKQYAQLCAILKDIEDKSAKREVEGVDELYEDLFNLTIPSMPGRIIRKMPLRDSHALFVTVLKHYGVDLSTEKKNQPASS